MMPFNKTFYRRNLPHWQPQDGVFNICFRLYGSLPVEVVKNLKAARDMRMRELLEDIENEEEAKEIIAKERDLYFGKFDALLDSGDYGPTYLRQPEIAQIVADCLQYWHEKGRYKLICFCIMPNHVHLILYRTKIPLFKILQTIKTYTATQANKVLKRTGNHFWHRESYDNLVRDRLGLGVKINYQLQNPVKAKLCLHWQEWDFTYLHPEFEKYVTPSSPSG